MNDSPQEILKRALLKLEATGEDGFEGFIASVLAEISDQPFRIASSGTQRGRDGESESDEGAINFETKLHKGRVRKDQIAVKLVDLLADDQGQLDIFIICSTASISAQHAKDFRNMFESNGITLLILDWNRNTGLPRLATLVAMGSTAAKNFLTMHLNDPNDSALLNDALNAIDQLVSLPEFKSHSEKLLTEITNASIGLGLAKKSNRIWLSEIFSCQKLARQYLGQPLAPRDASMDFLQPRMTLSEQLKHAFIGTSSDIVFVVSGTEGTGKSWLIANTWLQCESASILVIATSTEFRDPEDIINFEDFVIRKLNEQTGGEHNQKSVNRWKRRLNVWQAVSAPLNMRITVCIDGLNQNSRFPWARLIDGASNYLSRLGGQLVVSTRSSYFSRIRPSVWADVAYIDVPEFTNTELDNVLEARDIDPKSLNEPVYRTLKNPRILNIAVKLLLTQEIEDMTQLSVGRLLFEHLRTSNLTGSTDLLPIEFANTMSNLANEFISRLEAGAEDDLKLFDVGNHSRLEEVSSGRFFKPVVEDPDRYEIVDDGLILALGMWLVKALRRESRNERDPHDGLEVILEPVSTLDKLAEIVGTAIQVACLTESYETKIATSLIRHFEGLQNLPEEQFQPFKALVKVRPDAFLEAAKEVALFDSNGPTSGWLHEAILEARDEPSVMCEIQSAIPKWLSYYYPAPENMMHEPRREPLSDKALAERERVTQELKDRMEELTEAETSYMDKNLTRLEEGDVNVLHRFALFLLAGLPLETFAGPLVSSVFSASLTRAVGSLHLEFENLIRFNYVDWAETQKALNQEISCLGDERSSVGDWTIVKVLNSTGDPSDADEAQVLRESLIENYKRPGRWRLIEDYCETDPCDPQASPSKNISKTAKKYQNIDIEKLCTSTGTSMETHFFKDAMPGIARFKSEAGVIAIRRLVTHSLEREGLPRRQAILALEPFSVLLPSSDVESLVNYAQSSSARPEPQHNVPDEWMTAQHSLLIAFPHLSGDEQLEALNGMRTKAVLDGFYCMIKPSEAHRVETLLNKAHIDKNVDRLFNLLAAVNHADPPPTDKTIDTVAELLAFPDTTVRAEALALAARSKHELLLKLITDGDWNADKLTLNENRNELSYGSSALVAAVKAGQIDVNNALDRIALSYYGIAATILGEGVAKEVADRIEIALRSALDLGELTDLPIIEQVITEDDPSLPTQVSIREHSYSENSQAVLKHLSETDTQIQERQGRLLRAYKQFIERLSSLDAELILTHISARGMETIISARPDVIVRWHALLMDTDEVQKRYAHNFAIVFAGAIAEENTTLAVSLFRAYANTNPLIGRVFENSNVPVEVDVLWSNGHIPEISALCIERLDNCCDDQEISTEVLAAFTNNRESVLASYVERLMSTGEPIHIARALTVAGFSVESEFAENAISRFDGSEGFIGEVYTAAKGAYDRNRWSRNWYEQMRSANTEVEFWRYSVLLSRIVDGRFTFWRGFDPNAELYNAFFPTIKSSLERRMSKWTEKRKKALFGRNVPNRIFLTREL